MLVRVWVRGPASKGAANKFWVMMTGQFHPTHHRGYDWTECIDLGVWYQADINRAFRPDYPWPWLSWHGKFHYEHATTFSFQPVWE